MDGIFSCLTNKGRYIEVVRAAKTKKNCEQLHDASTKMQLHSVFKMCFESVTRLWKIVKDCRRLSKIGPKKCSKGLGFVEWFSPLKYTAFNTESTAQAP